jgi:hypothetical protein
MDNDDTIESNGQLSAYLVEENDSALRQDDSSSSHVSTPDHGSGPRFEKPPQLVRIPFSFIFSDYEESLTCYHPFPSPDAEPKPADDELSTISVEEDVQTFRMTLAPATTQPTFTFGSTPWQLLLQNHRLGHQPTNVAVVRERFFQVARNS